MGQQVPASRSAIMARATSPLLMAAVQSPAPRSTVADNGVLVATIPKCPISLLTALNADTPATMVSPSLMYTAVQRASLFKIHTSTI